MSTDEWLLEALERAIADPTPRRLFGTPAKPGIFLSSAAPAKAAAQRCLGEGWIRPAGEARTGKQVTPLYAVTPRGVEYALNRSPAPRLLMAMLEATEHAASAITQCSQSLEGLLEQTVNLRTAIQQAAARVQLPDVQGVFERISAANPREHRGAELEQAVESYLGQRRSRAPLQPCPLPELYQHCRAQQASLTIGQFHDMVRRMATEKRLRLLPFTQALYQLPSPEYALLAGREVMYYVEPL